MKNIRTIIIGWYGIGMNNTSLFLVIEGDNNLGEGLGKSEPLEEEAISCVIAWRANAGIWKDADIYVICPSRRTPSRWTINELKKLKCIYIEKYFPETENFTCGYWNVPIACQYLEQIADYGTLIHIDLDMKLIKKIREKYIRMGLSGYNCANVGALYNMKEFKITDCPYNFESNFIIVSKSMYFFKEWWYTLQNLSKWYENKKLQPEQWAELEEFAIDKMFLNNFPINPIKYYQVGPRYKAEHIPDEKLDNIVFIHRHSYEDNEEYGKYLLRRNRWEKK